MKNKTIWNALIISISLFPILSCAIHANAMNTTDSIYFRIQLDTLGGLRTGQILQLTYALVNSEFDTVSYPIFNDSIEVINGPKPYKSSSYAIKNGIEKRTHEIGFCYLIRFKQSGNTYLPTASVISNNQTFTTPKYKVYVHPAKIKRNTLKCTLKVKRLTDAHHKYCATLTCNTRPDQNPPLLSINGEEIRPGSRSYSNSEGKEEFVYDYYFTCEYYEITCKDLTFGGIPYSIEPQKNKIDDTDVTYYLCDKRLPTNEATDKKLICSTAHNK